MRMKIAARIGVESFFIWPGTERWFWVRINAHRPIPAIFSAEATRFVIILTFIDKSLALSIEWVVIVEFGVMKSKSLIAWNIFRLSILVLNVCQITWERSTHLHSRSTVDRGPILVVRCRLESERIVIRIVQARMHSFRFFVFVFHCRLVTPL